MKSHTWERPDQKPQQQMHFWKMVFKVYLPCVPLPMLAVSHLEELINSVRLKSRASQIPTQRHQLPLG